MKSLLKPGKYVVAVSGGIDSMVLLDMLRKDSKLEVVVAHFDHGIRDDSRSDETLVRQAAQALPYYTERAELGLNASEQVARQHRYAFLYKVMAETCADAIVTAHHQDDLIETAALNMLRGTKRRGFVSLKSTHTVKRPLLTMSKSEIKEYASSHHIHWREDSTNTDTRYLRNRIRQQLAKTLTSEKRLQIITLLTDIQQLNEQIEELVDVYTRGELHRAQLNTMGLAEAYEIIAGWLRNRGVGFDRAAIARLVIGSRTLQNKAQIEVQGGYYCELNRNEIILKRR